MDAILIYIFIGIILFFIVSLYFWNGYQRRKGSTSRTPEEPVLQDSGCCSLHDVCVKNKVATPNEKPEYFDDEELDEFAGRAADSYSEEETALFREIFHSVLDAEKPEWLRSLQLRNIAIPESMHDEAIQALKARKQQS